MKFNMISSKMLAPYVHGDSKIVVHASFGVSMSGVVLVRSIGLNLEGSEEADLLTLEGAFLLGEAAVFDSIGEDGIVA